MLFKIYKKSINSFHIARLLKFPAQLQLLPSNTEEYKKVKGIINKLVKANRYIYPRMKQTRWRVFIYKEDQVEALTYGVKYKLQF